MEISTHVSLIVGPQWNFRQQNFRGDRAAVEKLMALYPVINDTTP